AYIGIVEGRYVAVDEQITGDVWCDQFADRLRCLAPDVPQLRDRNPEIRVVFAGDEGQKARRDVLDDRVFDAVEIGPARLPVVRVAGHGDRLVRLEIDEFERAGADRMFAHVAR